MILYLTKMKKLTILLFIFSMLGCENNSPLKHKTENVQACLDLLLLHQKKRYEYLEHCELILVKDKYTLDIGDLHYGANKIVLTDVKPSEIQVYWSEKQDTKKRYMKIEYKVGNNDSVNVNMGLPNVNEVIRFSLAKKGSVWQPRITVMDQY